MKMTVIPTIDGALGIILKNLEKRQGNGDPRKNSDYPDRILMRSARILRGVLES